MDSLSLRPDPALAMPLPPPLPGPRRGWLGWSGHLFLLTAWLLGLVALGQCSTPAVS